MSGDHGLADLGSLGDPEELRARAAAAMDGFGSGMRSDSYHEGTDVSNSAWVTVDGSGNVIDVSISGQWMHRLPSDQLGEAVRAAYLKAHEKRAAAFAIRDKGESQERETSHEPPANIPDVNDEEWLDWVWRSLGEARHKLDRIAAGPVAQPPVEYTIESPAGYVRLRVVGRMVVAVLIDTPHVAMRSPEKIAAELREAFGQAYMYQRCGKPVS